MGEAMTMHQLNLGFNDDLDALPDPTPPRTEPGDMWRLGDHRLVCGDVTDPRIVARVAGGEPCALVHADPPYGMGKDFANDNLHGSRLDAFQMKWWAACRPCLADNASAYIWGTSPDLWRLWYVGGLGDSERLTMRNEIVWDKGSAGFGVGTESLRCYFPSEHCLFFMLGEQGFNTNAENYWEGFEPIRAYLAGECEKMKWGPKDIHRICGVGMYSHWFSKSQWVFIPKDHYMKLQKAANGEAFTDSHTSLGGALGSLDRTEYQVLKDEFYATRAYFDNTHDNMTDVWQFDRVRGSERHGHDTPKPVEMMARVIQSSAPTGAAVLVPFAGTFPEVIAAQITGRRAFGVEVNPTHVDVAVGRWEKFTGEDGKR